MKVYIEYEVKETNEIIQPIADQLLSTTTELIKYRVMWGLRKLEDEIEEEGGQIIVHMNGRIHTKSFTPELTEKIKVALKTVFEND
ncbi:hypothetical protein HHL17_30965 [Chitinophaga sp. G-6-1-13]|uniref:Uncharacterized protein n=1 Tax=Chitinophaga fulva TaxID=2728842 RepID=A0A848GU89_9BACT|nr:hypothetical protein [Chitinophaga fulva]NML41647.1 hypothetical protein [Chitinophaga fulva]